MMKMEEREERNESDYINNSFTTKTHIGFYTNTIMR